MSGEKVLEQIRREGGRAPVWDEKNDARQLYLLYLPVRSGRKFGRLSFMIEELIPHISNVPLLPVKYCVSDSDTKPCFPSPPPHILSKTVDGECLLV